MVAWARGSRTAGAGRLRALVAAALALVVIAFSSAFPRTALAAFTPPPLRGHVVDTAGKLSQAEMLRLDRKLDAIRQKTGFEIVAFVAGNLEGEPIEDIAYKAFNTWKIGQERADNGVLLVIAPAERRVRIETGKGVGAELTDLQSNDIIREVIAPLLQQDRFYEAVDRGTIAIADTLLKGADGKAPAQKVAKPPDMVRTALTAGGILLVIILSIVSPTFRSLLWFIIQLFLLSGGRGGGGGSGYGGGGGRSGGGGSSDSY
ncbi:TPM domain-containing protein [Chondromyces crocatus]|uniref:Methanol dehydrogenase n=1 Tax=Chondromyces crocatus TaxID=52 RepID=A0A0K1EKT4_CHOCO|nr:TPM domain-containing protein [Chondromyces crocatus]AKT41494.1 methanol dehydrogenase [Chondromyces crocatus]